MLPISGFEKRQFNIRYHLALLHYTALEQEILNTLLFINDFILNFPLFNFLIQKSQRKVGISKLLFLQFLTLT